MLHDAHEEGEETATGTIEDADLMPAVLPVRFGFATAEQVVTHIEERIAARHQRGCRGADGGPGAAARQGARLRARLPVAVRVADQRSNNESIADRDHKLC